MTMVLELTEKQQERLRRYAAQQGKNPQTVVIEWLDTLPEQPETVESLPPRIPGLGEGNIYYMAPDFDDLLPDEFWLGNEANDPIYK